MAFVLPGGAGSATVVGAAATTAEQLSLAQEELIPEDARCTALPLHEGTKSRDLLRRALRAWHIPVESLQLYLGGRAGGYFAFMDSYQGSLVLPSAVAAVLVAWRRRKTGAVVLAEPAFRAAIRLAVAAWSLSIVTRVQRLQQRVSKLPAKPTAPSPPPSPPPPAPPVASASGAGSGDAGQSHVAHLFSTAALLAGAGGTIVASLNLQGYIVRPNSKFAVPLFQRLASPGGLFDCTHTVKGLLPVVLHSIVMNLVNAKYTDVCTVQSASDGSGSAAVIVKRLCFEFMDTFFPFLWLVFARGTDVRTARGFTLAGDIQSMFTNDPIRRFAVESLLPLLSSAYMQRGLRMLFLRSRQQRKAPKNRLAFVSRSSESKSAPPAAINRYH
jgi:hypothetical protein